MPEKVPLTRDSIAWCSQCGEDLRTTEQGFMPSHPLGQVLDWQKRLWILMRDLQYTSIAGGVCISGGVIIGESCYLGTNCSIRGDLTVGKNSLIGMGSVVLENIAEDCVAAGNPAKILRKTKL